MNPELREKAKALPTQPGVYVFKDEAGRPIYVGKAKSLRHRVQSYFKDAPFGDEKRDRMLAAAADLEALDELAASLGASRRLGKGVSEVLAEHERSLRDDERNRLVGSASMVQPKLAAILAGIYLPEFVLLVIAPLFIGAIGRI